MGYTVDPEAVETAVLNDLVEFRGTRVLEVGCGDGRLTWRYASKANGVLALDPNAEKIDRAIESMPEHLIGVVEFEAVDINDRELGPSQYDVAILSYSL